MLVREVRIIPDEISVREAAVLLERTPAEVEQLIEAGEFAAEEREGRLYVDYASLDAYRADRRGEQS